MSAEERSGMYAMALFRVAERAGKVDEWGESLVHIRDLLVRIRDFVIFLSSPAIPAEEKKNLVDKVSLQYGFAREVAGFFQILVRNRELGLIHDILRDYDTLADHYFRRMDVDVESAVPLDEREKSRLERSLARKLRSTLKVSYKVDPGLIGGLLIRAGEKVYDGSIKGQLESLTRTMTR